MKKPLTISLIIASGGILGFMLFQFWNIKHEESQEPQIDFQSTLSDLINLNGATGDLYNAVVKPFVGDLKIENNSNNLRWKSPDGYFIEIVTTEGVQMSDGVEYDSRESLLASKKYSDIINKFDMYMTSHGFQIDGNNTFINEYPINFEFYRKTYVDGKTICSLGLGPYAYDFPSDFGLQLQCANNYLEKYHYDKPILDFLGVRLGEEYGLLHIIVEKEFNGFIRIFSHGQDGSYTILKRKGKSFERVTEWDDWSYENIYPACSVMLEHSVPKEIYGECDEKS